MPDDDRDTILALLRRQEAATARGDAAAVVASMAEDVVAYDLPPPLEYRGDAARGIAELDAWFTTWEGPVAVRLADPAILVEGDLAVAFGLSHMQGVKKDGAAVDAWNRRTVVLRRRAQGWRIVHEHSSYPMAMDGSGRAVTDLEP